MTLKTRLIAIFAKSQERTYASAAKNAIRDQEIIFKQLIRTGKDTQFGLDHSFGEIQSHKQFVQRVPIRDYENLTEYIQAIIEGKKDVLWKGKPKYFAKTSGTTSGIKYIPITQESIPNHMDSARDALFNYLLKKKDFSVFDGRVIFLSGSPELGRTGNVLTGRLSGIVNHEIPFWIKTNQLPSYETNCIEDWEEKLEKIIEETLPMDMRLISGIPPWVQMYFEKLLEITGKKTIKEIFPNFQLFMYGGVNYEPYRLSMEKLIGDSVDSIELYPASEGFIAYQDGLQNEGLLLNTNSGIFYEFVPANEILDSNPTRLTLGEIEIGKDYVLILSNNAGLWAYNLGDTVQFVSLDPYRLVVSGRVKHFISAFGEHVIGKEVEEAIMKVANKHMVQINEFSVAPQVNPANGENPYHEWFVEFETQPGGLMSFSKEVDEELSAQNIYYKDLIEGKILQPLKITVLEKNAFRNYMKNQGKLGGQNKVPRLANDRQIANGLEAYRLKINK